MTDVLNNLGDSGSAGIESARNALLSVVLKPAGEMFRDIVEADGSQRSGVDDALQVVDQGALNIADGFTSNGASAMRDGLYGDAAAPRQTDGLYGLLNLGGQVGGFIVSLGNPCAVAPLMGTAMRGLGVVEAIGNAQGAVDAYNRGDTLGAIFSGLGAFLGVAQLGKSCFAAGTPILTPEGSRSIEDLRVGDRVLSLPEDDPEGTPEPRRVASVFESYGPLLELVVGGRSIRTTAEHPFWVVGRGWRAAQQLVAGDVLMSHEKHPVAVEAVGGGREPARVYNVEVEGYHTYFVGSALWDWTVWAHNSQDCTHLADYELMGPSGNLLARGSEASGYNFAAKPNELFSWLEQAWFGHTEGKIVDHLANERGLLGPGTQLDISGTNPCCSNCQRILQWASEHFSMTITYTDASDNVRWWQNGLGWMD